MASVGANFNGSIFRKDFSCVIATNRHTAVMLPVSLRYNSSGVPAGTVLARNTTDGLYDSWANGGASGTGTAACVLFESYDATDFPVQASSGAVVAVGIFGGCTVYKGALPNYASGVLTGLNGRVVTDASGVDTILF